MSWASRTLNVKRMRRELRGEESAFAARPLVRSECAESERPCPFLKYNALRKLHARLEP